MSKMWQISLLILVTGITAVTALPVNPAGYESLTSVIIDGQGQLLTNGRNWSLTDHIALPSMSRLIALEGRISSGDPCAGVLASVDDTYLLTNSSWRCSPFASTGWSGLGFQDSWWSNAVEYGSNGNHATCTQQMHFDDISSNAKWIWSNDLSSSTVFCRGYLPLCQTSSPCLNGGTCLPNDQKMCDCSPEFTGTYCESQLMDGALVITAYQQLYVMYIDGEQQTLKNGTKWNQTDRAGLMETNRLIAVRALGDGTCGGILASFGDAYVLTNAQWRCSPYNFANWHILGFDDSQDSWFNAVEFGSNADGHTRCSQLQTIPGISANAMWIWHANQTETTLYCRGYMPVCDSSPCLNSGTCLQNNVEICRCLPQFTGTYCETEILVTETTKMTTGITTTEQTTNSQTTPEQMDEALLITGYQELQLMYIDGEQQSMINGNMWNQTDHAGLTETNRLVAVKALGDGTCGGLLASVGDTYFLTNAEWKCSPYQFSNWYILGFDDSQEFWFNAVEFGSNADGHTRCSQLQTIPDISANAMWIWVPDQTEKTLYCRGYMPVCDSSPCQNNGTCLQNNVKICSCLPQYTGTYCETVLG